MKCIIYKSIPTEELQNRSLNKMLSAAKKFNHDNNITGCIFVTPEKVVQLIEGEDDVIDSL